MSGDYKNNCYEENISHVRHFQGENNENCPQAEELVDDLETTKAMNIVSFIPVRPNCMKLFQEGNWQQRVVPA